MKNILFVTLMVFANITNYLTAEEGMYPLSEIHKLDLKQKGLQIVLNDLYNPDGISLIDGICKVNGCSGSFVSEKGLILTNHHCAYSAIKNASTAEHDYLENGFHAKKQGEEVPAQGYTVRITESYRDVSEEVLSVITKDMPLVERTKAIEKKKKEIIKQVEAENPGKRASVSEMFIGKTYVLFIYDYLKDIRLVYAPPRSIGNYGGETDNWIWPRHTGDFSIMRAYVAPDGSPAGYSEDNIPYTPKKVIQIAPEGVNEEDFVFILGYPGRTYRHRTSDFVGYEYNTRMPYLVDLFQSQINTMEEISATDRDVALKHLSKIKWRSNVMKNYRGKILGIGRMDLINNKIEEEMKLQDFIKSDKKLSKKYGTVIEDIKKEYDEKAEVAEFNMLLSYFNYSSDLLSIANKIYEGAHELQKDDVEREPAYMNRSLEQTKKKLSLQLNDFYAPSDKLLLKNHLERILNLPMSQRFQVIDDMFHGENFSQQIDEYVNEMYESSKLYDEEYVFELFGKTPEEIESVDDPFIQLAVKFYPYYQKQKEISKARKGALDILYAKLIDVKKEFLGTDFVPDANSTLRLTYGNIRGYSPKDAVYSYPITTLDGVVEKASGEFPFDAPDRLVSLQKQKKFGKYKHPKLGSVPVGILYNMDTTGGNSGSAVLNAKGELVGINFDRAYEATINDFAWSEDYSRSIAVDVRYVLWVLDVFSGANNIVDELGIN